MREWTPEIVNLYQDAVIEAGELQMKLIPYLAHDAEPMRHLQDFMSLMTHAVLFQREPPYPAHHITGAGS